MLITHSVEEAIYHDGDGPPRWVSFTVAYGRYSILRERVSCTVHDGNRDNERRASLGEKSKVVGVVAANRRSAGQDYAGRVGTVFGAGGCSTASSSGNFSPCTAIGVPIQSGFAR